MTKSLTEQWKDDTLPDGYYYTKKITYPETYPSCDEHIIESIDLYGCDYGFDDDMDICEVLAPVPSYDEWKELDDELKELATKNDTLAMENGRLQERLAIATKALGYYAQCKHINLDLVTIRDDCAEFEAFDDGEHARKALKEMEGVK